MRMCREVVYQKSRETRDTHKMMVARLTALQTRGLCSALEHQRPTTISLSPGKECTLVPCMYNLFGIRGGGDLRKAYNSNRDLKQWQKTITSPTAKTIPGGIPNLLALAFNYKEYPQAQNRTAQRAKLHAFRLAYSVVGGWLCRVRIESPRDRTLPSR